MLTLFKVFFNPAWLCENVFTLYGGGGKKAKTPKAPDYTALAQQQASASRMNQVTPYGSLTYENTGKDEYGNDKWQATTTLSPVQQQLLDQQNQISLGLGAPMSSVLQNLTNSVSNPIDVNSLPAQQIDAGQTVQDALMSRLSPQFDRRQQQIDTQLANQGISQGTEAFRNAQTDLGNQRNDAYIQAALQGMNTGQQARQQALNEQLTLRNEPVNMLNALRTGASVQNPTFFSPNSFQTPDYMGAGQNQFNAGMNAFNAKQAGSNNFMGGLMSLGGSALGAAGTAGGFGNLFGGLF